MNATSISCSTYTWSSNSLGQSSCEIAEYLNSVCTTSNGSYFSELTSASGYTLSAEDQNPCLCTTVVYNLVSLCRLCQSEDLLYPTWDQWSEHCTSISDGFPLELPGGTAVPDWAYQNVTGTNAFNETLAAAVATTDHAESSSSASPSSTGSATTSPTTSPFTSPEESLSSGNSHAAAVIAGLIAGVIGMGLLAVAILFLIRRRRRSQIAPSAVYMESSRGVGDVASRGQYAPIGLKTEREVPYLPYSIVGGSENHSSLSFDPYSEISKSESATSPPGYGRSG